jgi:hypothetical protein
MAVLIDYALCIAVLLDCALLCYSTVHCSVWLWVHCMFRSRDLSVCKGTWHFGPYLWIRQLNRLLAKQIGNSEKPIPWFSGKPFTARGTHELLASIGFILVGVLLYPILTLVQLWTLFLSTLPTPDFQSLRVVLQSLQDFTSVLRVHTGFYTIKDYWVFSLLSV